jgi:asparagine synthase (glutamine-hydrolysing)
MCGVNGIVNFATLVKDSVQTVDMMNTALQHRGPDGEGTFLSKNGKVLFGHRRLSIVDVQKGSQPFVVNCNGFSYVITYNGEIYNYKELRKELKALGHIFRTNSDTEVLLHSYIEWGERCLNRFNGQFAFVIYDEKEEKIFLARDRVGIKPLYYTTLEDGSFVFSSEPKGILAHPDFKKEPDHKTIADFFLGMVSFIDWCPSLTRSFFEGLHALAPGTYAILDHAGFNIMQYWDVLIPDKKIYTSAITLLGDALKKSIYMRIPEEVPFGTALSGGLDSSIITSIAADTVSDSLKSATIRFQDVAENPDFEHAKILAQSKGLSHITPELTAEAMIADVDLMIKAMDAPHDTIRQLGLFATYRNLRDVGCKVVLVGEGSDEFNLGYYYFCSGFLHDRHVCDTSQKFKQVLWKRISHVSQYFSEDFLTSVDFNAIIDYNISQYFIKSKSKDSLDMMQYLYAKRFLKYRLDANDRCAMAHSVEARVPFCDHNVVNVSLSVSPELNLKNGTEKHVLREAFKNNLPSKLVERRKYALPESKDVSLYKLLLGVLEKNIISCSPRVWSILSKNYALELAHMFKEEIKRIEGGSENCLSKNIPLSHDVSLRVKHVFTILTFLRWFQLYFE